MAVAIVVTVGIAAPELLPAIPFLLAGDIGIFGGGGGGGPCEEDPEACAPPPPPPLSGDDVNPPPPPTDIVDISRGGFEEARAAGVYGNQPIQLAEGNYAHSVLTPGLADQGFNTQ